MRGRKRTTDTRTAIVRGAAAIFAQREFHEVLTDDIAQHVGVGKGTIYRYFGSKDELYLAAIADGLDEFHAAVTSVLQQDAPLAATIDAVARTMITHFWRRRDFLVLIARLEPKLKPRQRADWQRRRAELVTLIQRVLSRAAARGEIGRVNARLAVEAFFGMIRGLCIYRAEGDRPEELARLVTTLFLVGLRGDTAAKGDGPRSLAVVSGGRRRP